MVTDPALHSTGRAADEELAADELAADERGDKPRGRGIGMTTSGGDQLGRRPNDPWWRSREPGRHLPAHLAEALRTARTRRGWSVMQAARELELSDGCLRHLEKGDRRPSAEVVGRLVLGYRLPADVEDGLRAVQAPYGGRSSPNRTGRAPEPGDSW